MKTWKKTLKNVKLKDVVFSLANCWASVSTLLINKSWKNLLPNFIDSEVEENVKTEEIQLASLINQLQNTNPMSNTEALQWAAETDDSLARNEILTDDEIFRTVTAEDDDDDVNPVKILILRLWRHSTLHYSGLKSKILKHKMMLLRCLRDQTFELKIGKAAQKKSLTFLNIDYVHSLTYVVIIMYVHIMFIQFIHKILVHTNIP
ncbi:hypothetical protein AVEN_12869-1 [Araneus ventricosus]|uniref:DDE-1 domain-containing protein n=1 Tax=Araneus ventricosus TaxID=182803 RepID=A0A4Y2WKU4_ARAVE|nr:hypothetical protein AVEN_12869-1 [Araneus ventricosus]